MDPNTKSPETLHEVGKGGKSKMIGDAFVNPGTPATPLATEEDLPNAEVSKSGSQKLRDGLIRD